MRGYFLLTLIFLLGTESTDTRYFQFSMQLQVLFSISHRYHFIDIFLILTIVILEVTKSNRDFNNYGKLIA